MATYNTDEIVRFDPVAETYSIYGINAVKAVSALVFDPSQPGALRLSCHGMAEVDAMDKNGTGQGPWGTYSNVGNIWGGNFAPDGSLWVVDQSANWLLH